MIACDTSVLVAAFSRWHADHEPARVALAEADALIEHVAIETFSVLTRLPAPRRVPPRLVEEFLTHHFPDAAVRLPSSAAARVIEIARKHAVTGGAVYDLVVALAAATSGAALLTLDRRAAGTYRAAGVRYRMVSTPE
ncbi:MAG: PIN domain-containing protein [Actinomycetota bacterium]|nr:PIN domain-containing protein [Actinomycetota bacterium]